MKHCLRVDEPVPGDKLVIRTQTMNTDEQLTGLWTTIFELDLYEALKKQLPKEDFTLNLFINVEREDE